MLKEEQKQMKENVAVASKQVWKFFKGCFEHVQKSYLIFYVNFNIMTISMFPFQSQVWSNLEKLFECKKKCLENAQKSEREDTVIHREPGTETLVL